MARIATVVAVRHPKPEEDDRSVAVVPPCGACRELIVDYDPDALVIVPGPLAPLKLPVRATAAAAVPAVTFSALIATYRNRRRSPMDLPPRSVRVSTRASSATRSDRARRGAGRGGARPARDAVVQHRHAVQPDLPHLLHRIVAAQRRLAYLTRAEVARFLDEAGASAAARS